MPARGPRRLLVLRHGETLHNAAGIWQGRKDSALSPIGLAQADRAAPVVAAYSAGGRRRLGPRPGPADRRTGRAAAGMPVRLDPRLREIDVGEWQGATTAEVRHRVPRAAGRDGPGRGRAPWPDRRDGRRAGRPGSGPHSTTSSRGSRPAASRSSSATASPPAPGSPRWSGWTRCRPSRCCGALDNCHWAGLVEASLVSGAPVRHALADRRLEPRRLTDADLGRTHAARYTSAAPRGIRGCGAAGSAPPWHGGGQGFESPQLHDNVLARPLRGLASTFFVDPRGPTLSSTRSCLERKGS